MGVIRVLLVLVAACAALPDAATAALLEDKIVFASNRDGDYDIYSMDPDGSNVLQLTDAAGADFAPSVSPDGMRIVLTRGASVGDEGDIVVMNADGSGQQVIAAGAGLDPDWSPDGTKVVFGTLGHGAPEGVWTINADGTSKQFVTNVDRQMTQTSWAPDNGRIAFTVELNAFGEDGIYTVAPNGTGLQRITFPPPDSAVPGNPDWRFDSAKIAFDGVSTMNPDGTGAQPVASGSDPSWSPDGTRFAFVTGAPGNEEISRMNADGSAQTPLTSNSASDIDPAWGRISTLIGPGYPRPRGASPLRVSLVPAHTQCTAPNRTHGAPLAFPSCAPPQATSAYATTGTPDANGLGAFMNAYALFAVTPGNPATAADEADVDVTVHVNDVFTPALADYGGELRANVPVRITDRDNLPPVGGPGPGTTQPFAFGFDIACVGTAAIGTGSDCTLSTTIDALVPGAIKETRRAIWQVGQVRVFDGGADGEGSTTGDNTPFATQGVFIP